MIKHSCQLLWLASCLIAGTALAKDIQWETDYETALAKAKKEKKLVMTMVYTDWCGYCRKMDKDTYADAEVQKKVLADFVALRVNPEKRKSAAKLSEQWGTRGFPYTVFLDATGAKVGEIKGYVPANLFLSKLEQIVNNKKK
jgi:thioredoxin-related protein